MFFALHNRKVFKNNHRFDKANLQIDRRRLIGVVVFVIDRIPAVHWRTQRIAPIKYQK